MNYPKPIAAVSLLTILGFIWGSGYALAKYAMSHDVPPLGYSLWQSLGPAILLALFSFKKAHILSLKKHHWLYFFICGLLGIAIPNTNMYFIANHLSSSVLAVLVNTVPLLVYPLALLAGQEKLDKWRLFAILLGVTGIMLILNITSVNFHSNWCLLALLTPLCFALCSIYIGSKTYTMNAAMAACGMLLTSTILLTPLVIYKQDFYPLIAPFTPAKQVVILEIILSTLGYLLFFKLIQLAGPVFYSLTGGVVALTGLFWGYVIFAEQPSNYQLLATIFILVAISLLSWRQARQQERNTL